MQNPDRALDELKAQILLRTVCPHSFTRNSEPIFQQSWLACDHKIRLGKQCRLMSCGNTSAYVQEGIANENIDRSQLGNFFDDLINWIVAWSRNESDKILCFFLLLQIFCWEYNIPCKMTSMNPCVFLFVANSFNVSSVWRSQHKLCMTCIALAKNQLLVWSFPLYSEFWFFGSQFAEFQWIVKRPHQISELIERASFWGWINQGSER